MNNSNLRTKLLSIILAVTVLALTLSGCGLTGGGTGASGSSTASSLLTSAEASASSYAADTDGAASTAAAATESQADTTAAAGSIEYSGIIIPAYSGAAYISVNGNVPYFGADELASDSYESYSDLDGMGRCGVAAASVGRDIMPTEERGSIGSVKPTGWHTVKYDCVDGKYLYNRCHLIGYQLTGENANEKNLITGTRYLNIEGMLPFENMVADYVKETGNHVMYRVTPVFENQNLLAAGVLMEGYSVEDEGEGICFCIFAYNVQPGVVIDYASGDSHLSDGTEEDTTATATDAGATEAGATEAGASEAIETQPSASGTTESQSESPQTTESQTSEERTYILNINTMKFHDPDCSSAKKISADNKKEYTGTREELIDQGYEPCGNCKP